MQRYHSKEQFAIPLQNLNTWHVGGCAERFFKPSNVKELQTYLVHLPSDIPVTWLGLGSNLLIRDGGIAGSVIYTRDLSKYQLEPCGTVYVEAGVTCAKLARLCMKNNLSDAAFFAGIPGTVGGALAMNAGAFGGQTWEHLTHVYTIDRAGNLQEWTPDAFQIGYRTVASQVVDIHKVGFVAAKFTFKPKEKTLNSDPIKLLLQQRAQSQPIGTFNCGSVFKNPPQDYAARLIECSGLKGYRLGPVGVSEKHANFIINYKGATAENIESLMHLVQKTVQQSSGIVLEPEVRITGRQECRGGKNESA